MKAYFYFIPIFLLLNACQGDDKTPKPTGPPKIQVEDLVTLQGIDQSPQTFEGTPTDWSLYPNVEPEFKQAIEAHESNDKEACAEILSNLFGKNDFANQDELQGYVIAAYYGAGMYEKAILEILQRDRRRQDWNYALKQDMSICLREYARKNGIEEGEALVSRLQEKYGKKLLSPVFLVVPRQVISQLQEGIYSKSLNDFERYNNPLEEQIPQIIATYPDAPFIDHIYYYINEPEKALEVMPYGLLRDVLHYQAGYKILGEIWKADRAEGYRQKGENPEYAGTYPMFDDMLEYTKLEGATLAQAKKAMQYFETYIEEFPNRPHADDSAFWMAWIEAQRGNYDQTVAWLRKVEVLGNKDYNENYAFTRRLELKIAPYLNADQLRELARPGEESFGYAEEVMKDLIDQVSYQEALDLLEQPEYKRMAINGLVHLCEKEYMAMNFDRALEVADMALAQGAGSYGNLKNVKLHIEETKLMDKNSPEIYTKIASGLRTKFEDKAQAFAFIDRSIEQLGRAKDLSTLLYLKVVMLRDSNPYAVRAVVDEMLQRYPQASLTDDAIAELLYVQAMITRQLSLTEPYLQKLLQDFPNGNARDNGLNWVAMAYRRCCKGSYCPEIKKGDACDKARAYYQQILKDFPTTRFAGYAGQNLLTLPR